MLNEGAGASLLWGTEGARSYPAALLWPLAGFTVASDLSRSSLLPEQHWEVRRAIRTDVPL